ncbi:MAG: hypothetical protein ACLU60_02365 [Faecalimonas sp.]
MLTGAYTWRNYRANVKDEQANRGRTAGEEEEIKRNAEETSSIAKKALEDEEPVTKRTARLQYGSRGSREQDGYMGDGQHADPERQ